LCPPVLFFGVVGFFLGVLWFLLLLLFRFGLLPLRCFSRFGRLFLCVLVVRVRLVVWRVGLGALAACLLRLCVVPFVAVVLVVGFCALFRFSVVFRGLSLLSLLLSVLFLRLWLSVVVGGFFLSFPN